MVYFIFIIIISFTIIIFITHSSRDVTFRSQRKKADVMRFYVHIVFTFCTCNFDGINIQTMCAVMFFIADAVSRCVILTVLEVFMCLIC